jgi:hypothetical protein
MVFVFVRYPGSQSFFTRSKKTLTTLTVESAFNGKIMLKAKGLKKL